MDFLLLYADVLFRAPSDRKGNLEDLSIFLLMILCLGKQVKTFSATSSPELPFFTINGLSALPSSLESSSGNNAESSVLKARRSRGHVVISGMAGTARRSDGWELGGPTSA